MGFCAAGVYRGAMNGFLRANRRYLARRIATHPWLVCNPLIRERIGQALWITVRFSRLSHTVTPETPASRNFGVLSIATDPSAHGMGIGRALMHDAEIDLATRHDIGVTKDSFDLCNFFLCLSVAIDQHK